MKADGEAATVSRPEPSASRAAPRTEKETRRSHAAIPVVVVLVVLGLFLARYSILIPAGLGVTLFVSGFSLLGTRINPLSPHFYLTRKPAWSAIGVVFLGSFVLFGYTYYLWKTHLGTLIPHL